MDITLHHIDEGAGEPLILLHGNGEDGTCFKEQVGHFRDMFHVYAIDTRGHGLSPRGTAPFTLMQFADDLAGFMDHHGIAAAHLLGFSDGANIVLLFTLKHPERVLSMVLNGGNLFPEGLTEEVRRGDRAAYQRALEVGDRHQLDLLRLMMDEPHIDPDDLARLHVPTLVVAGTDDMIEEAHTRLIAQSIPGAELRFMEGGHFIIYDKPHEFNQVVEGFLSSLGDRGMGEDRS